MHKPIKFVEKGLSIAANGACVVFNTLNKINQRPSLTPKGSDKPLLKSYEKTKPPLGWPRETDSLCPTCTREARQAILDGRKDVSVLLTEKVGEIKATILERDGKILMVKDCPIHGHFEDVMAIDTDFFKHLEEVFPGRDIRAHNDEKLHNHGSSTIKHGRGSVLTVDLTNRCNMMCDPCFMDANQVGFVHELSWEDIKMVLDNAISIKPRRQMSVQFSGGEPTISPYFLDAVRYARKVGYNSVQAATNGIEFAKHPEFAKQAAEAGLRYAYLQFDGIGNAANAHRRAGSRLVPDFLHGQLHRLGRRHARRREGVRPADLRLPPELRRRHGHHDRQGNEGSRAGHGLPPGRAARQGRRRGQRRGTRALPVGGGHGARSGPQLRLVQVADALQADRSAEEVRQDLRRDQVGRTGQVRPGRGRPHAGRYREAPRRSLELPLRRRYVVPGSVQL